MAFKFYIDNQLTDQPLNDTELITSIKRDNQLGALLITQDVELQYGGNNGLLSGEISGYTYLKSLFDSGICNEAEITVYDQISGTETYLLYSGVIKIPSISIQEQEIILSTKVQDNSYYAYINNNRDIKVNFLANATKSREDFQPCPTSDIDMFNSNGCMYGSDIGAYYKGYLVTDAFEFIISAISDNKLGFQSDYLSNLEFPLALLKGQALLNPYTLFPAAPEPTYEISFAELYKEINKIYNLIFFIDNSGATPVLRIENFEYAFGSEIVHHFSDVLKIKTSVDITNLYSSVLVGSKEVVDGSSPAYTFNAATSYYGWKQEQFFPLGQCNINQELNLVNDYIIDNNAIQDILVLNGTQFIDNYFLVQVDPDTLQAAQFPYFGSVDCFYNLGINNFFKMQRHSILFESNFGNFLGIGTNGFRALIGDTGAQDIYFTTVPVPGNDPIFIPDTIDPLPFVNETTGGGYDGGNNYDNTTYIYTVPVTGDYSFLTRLQVQTAGFVGGEIMHVTVAIEAYTSGLVFKFSNEMHFDIGSNGFHTLDTTMSGLLNATDIVLCAFAITYSPNQTGNQQIPRFLAILNTSYFECNGTPEGGVSITSGNEDVKKYLHEFTYNIGAADFRTIKSSIVSAMTFEKDQITRTGWIYDMQHNDWTGQTTIKLITTNATLTN